MKIVLRINGKNQEFHTTPTARSTRKAYELRTELSGEFKKQLKDEQAVAFTPEIIDKMTAWVVEAWKHQFTADQYLDGYIGPFMDALDMMDAQINMVAQGMADFPNAEAWEPKTEPKEGR